MRHTIVDLSWLKEVLVNGIVHKHGYVGVAFSHTFPIVDHFTV